MFYEGLEFNFSQETFIIKIFDSALDALLSFTFTFGKLVTR